MEKKTFTITNETGLHARPATNVVNEANKYESEIHIHYKGKDVNLKSIMGVMSLGIGQSSEIEISADGKDEQDALVGIEKVIKEQNLGE